MADSVFVNKLSAIHKGSPGKSTAFPDVNLCPPSPPAGPVPTPLPNIAAAKDLAGGATSVKINGNPVAKKSSYFAKSTGNAMARSTGGGVITHVVEGKAYFTSFSMNVKIEGEPVPRHLDMMTHNHAAPSPGEAVGTYMGSMQMAMPKVPLIPEPKERKDDGKPFDYEMSVNQSVLNSTGCEYFLESSDGTFKAKGEPGASRAMGMVKVVFRNVLPAKLYCLTQKQNKQEFVMWRDVPSTLLQPLADAGDERGSLSSTPEFEAMPTATEPRPEITIKEVKADLPNDAGFPYWVPEGDPGHDES